MSGLRLSNMLRLGWLRPPPSLQASALCYRRKGDGIEILMIKSRGRGNWIIPKGWPKKGQSLADTAADEAFEESGALGTLHEEPIGEYRYTKGVGDGVTIRCYAAAYPLEVSEVEPDFPEADERKSKWFSQQEAAEKASFPELRQLIETFNPDNISAQPEEIT